MGRRKQCRDIEVRWVAGKSDLMLAFASQFVSQPVDVIIANSTPMVAVLKQLTSTIPIVFVGVADPIKPGFVKSFDHPGGNITGFTNIEETMGGKWVELLREIAPSVKRASMLINPESANAGANGGLYLKSIETAARDTGTELIVSAVHDPAGIDEVFAVARIEWWRSRHAEYFHGCAPRTHCRAGCAIPRANDLSTG